MVTLQQIEGQYTWLSAFFRSYYCFFALHPHCDYLDRKDEYLLPYRHVSNVLLYDTVINWCKIFGTRSEECHWTHVVEDHAAFRESLLSKLAVAQSEFNRYHRSMLSFRNKWVAHFDPMHEQDIVPKLDIAHNAAIALHEYLQANPTSGTTYAGPPSMASFGQRVAAAFLGELKVPPQP
jgi:hypothetical protein